MKLTPGKLFLAAAAFVIAGIALATKSQTAAAANADVEKAVLARLNDIQMAAQALDADKVFSFVMENEAGVIAQNGKMFMTRAEAMESTRQGFESLQNADAHIEYHFNNQHVTVLASNVALATGEGITVVTTADGKNVKTPFAQSVVLVLTNGDWKVLHAHRSFVPAAR